MARTTYRNGDKITLLCGCDGCSPSVINGVFCHETGCPEAWRDREAECFDCGCAFYRSDRHQRLCDDCLNPPEDDQFIALPLPEGYTDYDLD
jgi:hypothetical protein